MLAVLLPVSPDAPRDRPLAALPAGEGPLELAVLGTSLTLHATWPEALADRLAACTGRAVGVARRARAGAHSGWGAAEAGALAATAPDLVFVEFAINDADLHDGLSHAESRANHRAIVAALRDGAPGAAIALVTTNPVRGWRRLTRPRLGAHYRGYRDLAEELGIGLLDAYPRWREAPAGAMRDGVHPRPSAEEAVMLGPLLALTGAALGHDCGP